MMKKYKIYRERVILCVLLLLTQSCLGLFSSTPSKPEGPSRTSSKEELSESGEEDDITIFDVRPMSGNTSEERFEPADKNPSIPDPSPTILE